MLYGTPKMEVEMVVLHRDDSKQFWELKFSKPEPLVKPEEEKQEDESVGISKIQQFYTLHYFLKVSISATMLVKEMKCDQNKKTNKQARQQ